MKRKLRICLVAPVPPPYGGVGNWVLLIKKHVAARDDIVVDTISTAPARRGLDGRTVWDRVVTQGFLMLRINRELKKEISENHPDVIHITTSGELAVIRDILLLRTARKMNVPSIYHIRFGRISEIAKGDTFEWKLIAIAMKMATKVMTIDAGTHKAITAHLPNIDVVNVPNPIDLSALPTLTDTRSKTVVFLGWIVKTKGIEELLAAWGCVHANHDEWTLQLVGPYDNRYLEYLRMNFSFDGVDILGEKSHEEAMQILNNAEIFVLPSYTEGFPNAVLEAMALSKAIIATNVGAIPEMLASECGTVINPQNKRDIIMALEDFINDDVKRSEFGMRAYRRLIHTYTLDIIFKRYLNEWYSFGQ